jgi:hypothetical protein
MVLGLRWALLASLRPRRVRHILDQAIEGALEKIEDAKG